MKIKKFPLRKNFFAFGVHMFIEHNYFSIEQDNLLTVARNNLQEIVERFNESPHAARISEFVESSDGFLIQTNGNGDIDDGSGRGEKFIANFVNQGIASLNTDAAVYDGEERNIFDINERASSTTYQEYKELNPETNTVEAGFQNSQGLTSETIYYDNLLEATTAVKSILFLDALLDEAENRMQYGNDPNLLNIFYVFDTIMYGTLPLSLLSD
jgi:hypothetical protein